MAEIILHHYDPSPFSEKVRLLLGMKGLAWRSVIMPDVMPKPELTPLTGGYRRAPVMQVGADIFCDSQLAMVELERRAPGHLRGAAMAINQWADRPFFAVTVPLVFGLLGDQVRPDFAADREKLSGRPFDIAAMAAAAPAMKAQWRTQAAWIEQALQGADYLDGANPGVADAAAYMNPWFLARNLPDISKGLLTSFGRVRAWMDRLAAIGHGERSEMTAAEALEIARDAKPAGDIIHDPADPLGLSPGDAVVVRADDYGRDPVSGTLVAANAERIVVGRDEPGLGRLNVLFPRAGYIAYPGR